MKKIPQTDLKFFFVFVFLCTEFECILVKKKFC